MHVLILDNYDSFTYNLYQGVGEFGARVAVRRNDEITLAEVEDLAPDRILLSPGPGRPDAQAYFGVCAEVISALPPRIPILGICLGHQGVVAGFGGRIIAAPRPVHGQVSRVICDPESRLLGGFPSRFDVMRYHSLIADPATLPAELKVTAWTEDGIIMAVEHRRYPLYGIQFHPESIGTPLGKRLLRRFLTLPNLVTPPLATVETETTPTLVSV